MVRYRKYDNIKRKVKTLQEKGLTKSKKNPKPQPKKEPEETTF